MSERVVGEGNKQCNLSFVSCSTECSIRSPTPKPRRGALKKKDQMFSALLNQLDNSAITKPMKRVSFSEQDEVFYVENNKKLNKAIPFDLFRDESKFSINVCQIF